MNFTLNIKHWFLLEFSFIYSYLSLITNRADFNNSIICLKWRTHKQAYVFGLLLGTNLSCCSWNKKEEHIILNRINCCVLILVCSRTTLLRVLSYKTPDRSPLQGSNLLTSCGNTTNFINIGRRVNNMPGSVGVEKKLWAYIAKAPDIKFLTKQAPFSGKLRNSKSSMCTNQMSFSPAKSSGCGRSD